MKILKSTIIKKWFDMIKSGEKKEEYKDIKKFWKSRLVDKDFNFKEYDAIQFFNGGYLSDKIPNFLIEFEKIRVGTGQEKWGAKKGKDYYVLKLGKIL